MYRISSLLSVASLGLACASGEPAAPPAAIETRVSMISPKTSALDTSVMDVKVQIFNPRATPVVVNEVAYTLATGDVAGTIEGVVPSGATLEAEQQAEVGFEINVPIPADRLEELIAMDVVPADLSGEIRFADGGAASFAKKSGLAMPRLPAFVVFDAQAAQYRNKGVEVTLLLRLVNENAFTLPVQVVDYEVFVAGKSVRSEQAGVGSRLTPGAAEEYEVNVRLDDSSFKDLEAILASGVIKYRVTGEVSTKSAKVPFDHEGTIDLGSSE